MESRGNRPGVGREVHQQVRSAVKADQRDLVGHPADQRLQGVREVPVVIEVTGAGRTDLDGDHQRQWLAVRIRHQRYLLRDTIVGQGKVLRPEGEDRLPVVAAHQRGDEDEIGAGAEERRRCACRRRRGRLLGAGESRTEQQEKQRGQERQSQTHGSTV
jgi:hypothetical protein